MTREEKLKRIDELKRKIKAEHEKGNCNDAVVAMICECTRLAKEVICGE